MQQQAERDRFKGCGYPGPIAILHQTKGCSYNHGVNRAKETFTQEQSNIFTLQTRRCKNDQNDFDFTFVKQGNTRFKP